MEPPGRAVPRGAEPGLPLPPARCVGLGGDTRAPAFAARRQAAESGRERGGRRGRWGASPRAGQGAGAAHADAALLRSPGSRAARLAGLVAGAPGPPGNAASVAASVGSARARRRERSVSFDLFLCSASPGLGAASGAPGAPGDVSAPKSASPGAGSGKGEPPPGAWRGTCWPADGGGGAAGVSGKGARGTVGRPRDAGGGSWSCVCSERWRSWAVDGG